MQIYWNKRKRLHKKRVQLPQNSLRIGLGHQHGRRLIVLGHQYGRRDVMWKHYSTSFVQSNTDPGYEEDFCLPSSNNYIHEKSKPLGISA